jgi:hypothetical protein
MTQGRSDEILECPGFVQFLSVKSHDKKEILAMALFHAKKAQPDDDGPDP